MLTFYSFVPAESATLGLVDKSRILYSWRDNVLMYAQFLLGFKHANRSPRYSWTTPTTPSLCAPDLTPLPQEQSAFMIDLNQVSFALRNCTERSLIILDEFGKGTMSTGSSPFVHPLVALPVVSSSALAALCRLLLSRRIFC